MFMVNNKNTPNDKKQNTMKNEDKKQKTFYNKKNFCKVFN